MLKITARRDTHEEEEEEAWKIIISLNILESKNSKWTLKQIYKIDLKIRKTLIFCILHIYGYNWQIFYFCQIDLFCIFRPMKFRKRGTWYEQIYHAAQVRFCSLIATEENRKCWLLINKSIIVASRCYSCISQFICGNLNDLKVQITLKHEKIKHKII